MDIDQETIDEINKTEVEEGFKELQLPAGARTIPDLLPEESWATPEIVSKLRHGFQMLGGVVLYYHEGLKHGVTSHSIYLFNSIYKNRFGEFKQRLVKVPSREDIGVELPCEPSPPIPFVKSKVVGALDAKGIKFLKGPSRAMYPRPKVIDGTKVVKYDIGARPDILDLLVGSRQLAIELGVDCPYSIEGTIVTNELLGRFWEPTNEMIYPLYNPTYRNFGYDKEVLKASRMLASKAAPEVYVIMRQLAVDLSEATHAYRLTNGSLEGQVGRIAKGFTVRAAVRSAVDLKGSLLCPSFTRKIVNPEESNFFACQADHKFLAEILALRAPFAAKPDGYELFTEDLFLLSDFCWASRFSLNFRMVSVNLTASAGPYYHDEKKQITFVQDMLTARQLLNDLREAKENVRNVQISNAMSVNFFQSVFDKYKAMSMPSAKPKLEPIEASKVDTASRNYFNFNAGMQLPAAILYENIYTPMVNKDGTSETIHKNSLNPERYSLLSWSAEHGGFQDLLFTMGKQAFETGLSIAVYSDNLWILIYHRDTFWWFSLDGSSMECSIAPNDVVRLNTLILTEYFKGKAAPGWVAYAQHFHPKIVVDAIAILGGVQWLSVGQFSGTSGTAAINNYKMTMAGHTLERLLRENQSVWFLEEDPRDVMKSLSDTILGTDQDFRFIPGVKGELDSAVPMVSFSGSGEKFTILPRFNQAFLQLGIKIKIEMVTRSNLFRFLLDPTSIKFSEGKTYNIPLDLLGRDCFVLQTLPTIKGALPVFPQLDKARLTRALAFNKLEAYRDIADDSFKVLRQIRLKALYLQGGWADPAVGTLIRHLLYVGRVTATAFSLDETAPADAAALKELIAQVAGEGGLPLHDAFKQVLMSVALPSMHSVLTVYKDRSYADAIVLGTLKHKGIDDAIAFSDINIFLNVFGRSTKNFVMNLGEERGRQLEELFKSIEAGRVSKAEGDLDVLNENLRKGREKILAGFGNLPAEAEVLLNERKVHKVFRNLGVNYNEQASSQYIANYPVVDDMQGIVVLPKVVPKIGMVKVRIPISNVTLDYKTIPSSAFYIDALEPEERDVVQRLESLRLKPEEVATFKMADSYSLIQEVAELKKWTLPTPTFNLGVIGHLFFAWLINVRERIIDNLKYPMFNLVRARERSLEIASESEGLPIREARLKREAEALSKRLTDNLSADEIERIAVTDEYELKSGHKTKRDWFSKGLTVPTKRVASKSKEKEKEKEKEVKKGEVEPPVPTLKRVVWADEFVKKHPDLISYLYKSRWPPGMYTNFRFIHDVMNRSNSRDMTGVEIANLKQQMESLKETSIGTHPAVLTLMARFDYPIGITILTLHSAKKKPQDREQLINLVRRFAFLISSLQATKDRARIATLTTVYMKYFGNFFDSIEYIEESWPAFTKYALSPKFGVPETESQKEIVGAILAGAMSIEPTNKNPKKK